jgi:hypothetical protein
MRRLAEIGGVGLLRVFVPVGGEDALAPGAFKRNAEAADAAEEVNETKFAAVRAAAGAVRD